MADRSLPDDAVRTRARPRCPWCGADGIALHTDLEDPLFGTPGRWTIRRCPKSRCGLHWIDPVVLEAHLGQLYERYHTHAGGMHSPRSGRSRSHPLRRAMLARCFGYEATDLSGRVRWLAALLCSAPFLRERLGRSILWLNASESGRVLDVGCGAGELLGHLAELGWQSVGIEPDPAAAAAARGRGLEVHVGDLEHAPWRDESFDVVSLVHVIEHVPDPPATLARLRRLLRPGGKVVLVTPSVSSLGARHFGRNWRGWEVPRHLHLGNPESWARCLREAGFEEVTARTCAIGAGRTFARSASIRRRDHERGLDPNSAPTRDFHLRSALFELIEYLLAARPWRRPVGEEAIVTGRRED